MLGYNEGYVRQIVNECGIPSIDINLMIELISELQNQDKQANQIQIPKNMINNRNDIDPLIVNGLKNDS